MNITLQILNGLLIFIIFFLSTLVFWNITQGHSKKYQFLEGMNGTQTVQVDASGNTLNTPNNEPNVSSSLPQTTNKPSLNQSTDTHSISSTSTLPVSEQVSLPSPPVNIPPTISTPSSTPVVSVPSLNIVPSVEKNLTINPLTTNLAKNINDGLQTATDVVKLIDNNKLNDFYNAIKHKNLPSLGISSQNTANVGSNVTKYNF